MIEILKYYKSNGKMIVPRSAALKDSENGVKEANKKFLAGEGTWFENINEWSNLPEEDFAKQHCGMKQTSGTLF